LPHLPDFNVRPAARPGRRDHVIREVALTVRSGDLLTRDGVEAELVVKTGKVSSGDVDTPEEVLVVSQEDLGGRISLAVARRRGDARRSGRDGKRRAAQGRRAGVEHTTHL